MPIYLFRCPTCHQGLQVMQPYEAAAPICPTCWERVVRWGIDQDPVSRRVRMERQPTSAAVVFKGSGWTPKGPGRST